MPAARVSRSLVRKLESGNDFPMRALEGIREFRESLDQLEEDALCRARELGASITEIAEVMGMSRQSVYNRLKQIAERSSDRGRQQDPRKAAS